MLETEICIVGAGPGGAATALRLSYLGIPCILLDKAVFPRDKICGDAVSSKVTTLLNRLDPAILQRFLELPVQTDIWGIRFFAPNRHIIDIPFKADYTRNAKEAPGYVAKRVDFDHFLVSEVRNRPNITFLEGTAATAYTALEKGYHIETDAGPIQASLLIVADGAHSAFSRKVAGLEKDPAHHAAAVRAAGQG